MVSNLAVTEPVEEDDIESKTDNNLNTRLIIICDSINQTSKSWYLRMGIEKSQILLRIAFNQMFGITQGDWYNWAQIQRTNEINKIAMLNFGRISKYNAKCSTSRISCSFNNLPCLRRKEANITLDYNLYRIKNVWFVWPKWSFAIIKYIDSRLLCPNIWLSEQEPHFSPHPCPSYYPTRQALKAIGPAGAILIDSKMYSVCVSCIFC